MAIRDSGNMIPPERDSMVNMGENLTRDNIREMRRMKNEIVDPEIGMAKNAPKQLLPKMVDEESKIHDTTGIDSQLKNRRATRERYAAVDESNEVANEDSRLLLESNER